MNNENIIAADKVSARACVGVQVEGGGGTLFWRRMEEGVDGIDGYIVVSGNEKLPQISRWGIPGGAQAP